MGQEPAAPPAEGQKPDAPKDEANTAPSENGESPKTFDKQYVSELRSEAANWRTKAQQAAEKLEEYEEANKSELEKAQTKATKAEQKAAEAEGRLLRFQVAAEKQLPKELISRLRGNTQEELAADADELLSLVKSRTDTEKTPDFDGGAREPAPEPKSADEQHNESVLRLLGLSSQND
jgi:hypothetical protein